MATNLDYLCGNWQNQDDYSFYTITKVGEQYLIHGEKTFAEENSKSPFDNIGIITDAGNGNLKIVWRDTSRFAYANPKEQITIVKVISDSELHHDKDEKDEHPFYGNLKKICKYPN